jgi:hypothetical protein
MKQTLSIHIKGKRHSWSFTFKGDPKHIEAWQADGLEVYEVVGSAPRWAVDIGLLRAFIFVQDCWQKLRLW